MNSVWESDDDGEEWWDVVRAVVCKIIARMQEKGLLHGDEPADVFDRTLRYLRAYLRSRPPRHLSELSENAVARYLGCVAIRVLWPSASLAIGKQARLAAPNLENHAVYRARSYYRPKYQVGGDLVRIDKSVGNSVWLLLADVQGKSVAAHLTARTLETIWRLQCEIAEQRDSAELLSNLEIEMRPYLPEYLLIEGVVVRADESGEIDLAAAGGAHCLLGNCAAEIPIEVLAFGGRLFGAEYPAEFGRESRRLAPGQELVLVTDGVLDLQVDGGFFRRMSGSRICDIGNGAIFDRVLSVVDQALSTQEQFDDMTLVSLERLSG